MSVSLLAIAAVAMYGWIVSPHVGYLRAVQRYEPAVEREAAKKRILCTALGLKRRKLQDAQDELAALRGRFFTVDQGQVFFADLDALCTDAGCLVTSLDFNFTGPSSRVASAPAAVVAHRANLTMVGRYDQITVLLERLQDRPQQICIDSCRIELFDIRLARLKCDVAMTVWIVSDSEDPLDE